MRSKKPIVSRKNLIYIALLAVLGLFCAFLWTIVANNTARSPMSLTGAEYDEVKIAEKPLEKDEIDNYKTPADAPRILAVDKLDIRARIKPLGVTNAGAMQAPNNINDAGWYEKSAKPGESGVLMIDGHASGRTREGLFAWIDTLKTNDKITIEKGNGETIAYQVKLVETVPLDKVDMQKFSKVHGDNDQGVNLITCAGSWLQSGDTYDKRTIVYAVRAN